MRQILRPSALLEASPYRARASRPLPEGEGDFSPDRAKPQRERRGGGVGQQIDSLDQHHPSAALQIILLLFLASCSAPKSRQISPAPRRIISIVPSVTETLYAIGVGENVVAVGDYDHFPSEVEKKPRIGGLINPNIEKIISLNPDLVITYGTQDVLSERLQSVGIQTFPFRHGNVEETLHFISELGRRTGAEERALRLVQDIRKAFDDVRAHAPPRRPKVLLIHDRRAGTLGSFYSVGSRAFQHDLIEIAGGRNLFADVDMENLQPSLEEVISRRPDIILETLSPPLKPEDVVQRKKDWEGLGLARDHIYIEGESYLLIPGARFDLAVRRISEIVRGVR